jgi:maltoporin
MSAVGRRASKWPLGWLIWCIAMIPFAVVSATGQQADQLDQQLQQLKQQYEETTRNLEQRIATLEQQIEKQKETSGRAKEGTVSAVELRTQEATQKASSGNQIRSGQSSKANYLLNRRMTCSERRM